MPHMRSYEDLFYNRAVKGVDDAIGSDKKLFDALRAATLLSSWLYGMGRYHEVIHTFLT